MRVRHFTVRTALCASFACIQIAQADFVNSVRPDAVPVSGTALQDQFESWRISGPGISVASDQTRFARFTNAVSSAVAVLGLESTASGLTHRFGLYDAADPSRRAVLFDSTATASGSGAVVFGLNQRLIEFRKNGDIVVNGALAASGFSAPFDFGVFLEVFSGGSTPVLQHTYFSEDDLNPTTTGNPQGAPQALVFRGDGASVLEVSPLSRGVFTDSEFFFAFDDGAPDAKKDFTDFVVLFESAVPLPEPATGLLVGFGACFVGWARRRRRCGT